ncbi:hypothetical protein CL3_20350 [butyrate-producing bacterium SM4/1]|nr:hypothetical protein CLS_28850 [[Clostridium] cf. saccharolyticum K10]CBL36407.1 hypothetical protein CL3_20350 [butyrate-producing bacterium SM4/1]
MAAGTFLYSDTFSDFLFLFFLKFSDVFF